MFRLFLVKLCTMDWYLMPFKRWMDFSGRSRRKEYWLFLLFNIILVVSISLIAESLGVRDYANIPLAIYILAVIIPFLSLTIRRLHDIGKSGWYILIRLIPLIGGLWFLALMCTDSQYGDNKYGSNPKQPKRNELDDIGKNID